MSYDYRLLISVIVTIRLLLVIYCLSFKILFLTLGTNK